VILNKFRIISLARLTSRCCGVLFPST